MGWRERYEARGTEELVAGPADGGQRVRPGTPGA